jgi:hypothetical protein
MLIDEKDLEDDDDSLKVWETEVIQGRVILMKFIPEFN